MAIQVFAKIYYSTLGSDRLRSHCIKLMNIIPLKFLPVGFVPMATTHFLPLLLMQCSRTSMRALVGKYWFHKERNVGVFYCPITRQYIEYILNCLEYS